MEFNRESLKLLPLKGDNGLRTLAKKKGIKMPKGKGSKDDFIIAILKSQPGTKYTTDANPTRPAPPPPPMPPLTVALAQTIADQELKYRFAEGSAEEGLLLTRVERNLARAELRGILDAARTFELAETSEQLNIRKIEMGVEADLNLMTPTDMNSAMKQARDAVAYARAVGRIGEAKREAKMTMLSADAYSTSGETEYDSDSTSGETEYDSDSWEVFLEREEERRVADTEMMGAEDTRTKTRTSKRNLERVARYGSVFDKRNMRSKGGENMGLDGGNNPMAGFTSNDPYEQKIQQEKEEAMEMINYGRLIKRDRTLDSQMDMVAYHDRKAAWAEKHGAAIEEEKKRRALYKKQQAKKKRDAKKKK